MGLTLTVLGCSGSYAGPGGACSGYLVSNGATNVWVDCGPGTLANLQAHIELGAVDAVVATHSHADHWLELPVFRIAAKYGLNKTGIPVYGTADVHQLLGALVGEGEGDGHGIAPTFDFHVMGDGASFAVGDIRFTCSRTDHPVETLAIRADYDGRSLAYTADTGPDWRLTTFGRGLDLAVCDATLLPEEEGQVQHLSGRQAGAMAQEAGASALVVTHVWPTTAPEGQARDAADVYNGTVHLAATHKRYEL